KENLSQRCHLGLRLIPARRGSNATDDRVIESLAFTVARRVQWSPQICFGFKIRRGHPDDLIRQSRYSDDAPDHAGVSAERPLPEVMTENRDGWTVGNVFFTGELTADNGRDTEDAEETGAHALLANIADAAVTGEVQVADAVAVNGEI